MKTKILCSTGTLVGKANGFNYRLVIENKDRIEAEGFELMMLKAFYGRLPEIASDLNRAGIPIYAIHFEKDITALLGLGTDEDRREGLRIFAENVDMGRAVGAEKAVFHLWDGRFSPQQIESVIALLETLYEICDARGVELVVENVPSRSPSPYENIMKITERYPQARFTFDTRHGHFRGEVQTFFESDIWQTRIGHIHVSDYSGETVPGMWGVTRPILHPGEGKIDFETLFALMPPYHGETVTLESPVMRADGTVDIEKLNRTLGFLREKMKNH